MMRMEEGAVVGPLVPYYPYCLTGMMEGVEEQGVEVELPFEEHQDESEALEEEP